jgi:uncharacterized protein (TIGR00255 family)
LRGYLAVEKPAPVGAELAREPDYFENGPNMLSMTGFGRAARDWQGRRLVVEIRSVNHRALDIKLRSRVVGAACEIEILRAVRAALRRGAVQVSVEEEASERLLPFSLERVRAVHRALEQLGRDLGLSGPVDLSTVAAFLRLEREAGAGASSAVEWPALGPAVEEALSSLQQMRTREGLALAADMRGRAKRLARVVGDLHRHAGPLAQRAAGRLRERLLVLQAGAGLDPGRLAQEAALLADRLDVSEELARLDGHGARLDQLLSGTSDAESIGRTLEFLLQELARELNTLGVKAQDVEVSALVIEGKAELEKIREQAQNIE